MKPVRIGVIGYGNVGSMHAENLYTGKIKNSILAAVCDIDEGKRERAAKRFDGVPVFATHTELLAAGVVDAVIVSVPHYFHHVIAIDAFENGGTTSGTMMRTMMVSCPAAWRRSVMMLVMISTKMVTT